jgi:hypothetical protein
VNRAPSKSKPSAPRGAGCSGGVGQPDEPGLGVDEAPDQPGTGQPIHPGARAGGPALALELARIEPFDAVVELGLRLAPGEPGVQRQPQRVHRGLCMVGGGAGVVVDAAKRVQRLGHRSPAPTRLGFAEGWQIRLQGRDGVAPRRISLGAVEQRQQLITLRIVARRQRQHHGRAAVLAHLGGERLEQHRVFRREQIRAVAQGAAAQCLERAPDPHPHRVGLGREGQDQDG